MGPEEETAPNLIQIIYVFGLIGIFGGASVGFMPPFWVLEDPFIYCEWIEGEVIAIETRDYCMEDLCYTEYELTVEIQNNEGVKNQSIHMAENIGTTFEVGDTYNYPLCKWELSRGRKGSPMASTIIVTISSRFSAASGSIKSKAPVIARLK